MISEFLLNIVFTIVEGVFSLLPSFEWNVNYSFFSSALDMVRLACYLLPMETITVIFVLICQLTAIKIAISLIKTIWALLPMV